MDRFKVIPLDEACKCPMYLTTENNKKQCLLKQLTTPTAIAALFNDDIDLSNKDWRKDCKGKWESCSVLFSIYSDEQPQEEENIVLKHADNTINDYDPFADETEEEIEEVEEVVEEIEDDVDEIEEDNIEDEIEETEEVVEDDVEETEEEVEEEPELEEEPENQIKIGIHQVSDPYAVKVDALIYPTNSNLLIDDPLLNTKSYGFIQQQCDVIMNKLGGDVKIGGVYKTNNGGSDSSVVPKIVYHAVVAGPSRLVTHNIEVAVRKALLFAENDGAHSVAMLPCDCGVMDVYECARLQLKAIQNFVSRVKVKNIERIHIVMEDQESVEVFEECFKLIFD